MSLVLWLAIAVVAVSIGLVGRWAMAELVSWPEPPGQVFPGWQAWPRWPGARREYSAEQLVIRVRGVLVADLVVVAGDVEEVIVAGRSLEEARELYQAMVGEPWTRARLEGARRGRDAA